MVIFCVHFVVIYAILVQNGSNAIYNSPIIH